MPYTSLSLGSLEASALLDDPVRLICLCNAQRKSLASSPIQSSFRVFAIILFETPDIPGVQLVEGTNSESLYIGGSICAERAALCKLRFFSEATVLAVGITTDAASPIAPGLLCREYLISHCRAGDSIKPAPFVVLGGAEAESNPSTIVSCTIESLYPQPFLYRGVPRRNLISFGEAFAATKLQGGWAGEHRGLYDEVRSACDRVDSQKLHPLRLSAGVLYEDGSIDIAWLLIGAEYGCSLDPVSQLVSHILKRKSSASAMYLLQVDQHGICHAPFAQARALLTENGMTTSPTILVHDTNTGDLLHVTPESLAPSPPEKAEGVSGELIDALNTLKCSSESRDF